MGIAVTLTIATPFAACFVPDIDVTGRPCTNGVCPSGWECVAQVCQRSSQSSPDVAAASPDGGDAPSECTGALKVSGLRSTWRTTRSIRWEWNRSGDTAQFGSYELALTSNSPNAAGVKTWTASDNPELSQYKLPTHPTGEPDDVLSTLTHELSPDTQYHAQLIVKDSKGATCASLVADARTQTDSALESILIFSNGFSNDAVLDPPSFAIVSGDGGYEDSTSHLEVHWNPDAAGWPGLDGGCDEQQCYANFMAYTDVLTDRLLKPNFDNAFFEMAFSYSGELGTTAAPAWWASIYLNVTLDGGTNAFFFVEPLTLRAEAPGNYRLIQIPLRAFSNSTGPMNHEALAIGLNTFFVGGRWTTRSVIRLDKIYLRY